MIRIASLVLVVSACVATPPPDGPSGSSTPPANTALVGSWFAGSGGLSAPYDPNTGSYGMPNGSGLLYTLRGDGSYTKAFQSYQSANGCTTGFTAFDNGSYDAAAGSLHTLPANGQVQYRDTCAPSLNSDKPNLELAEEQFTVQLAGDQLTLTRTDGASAQFHRVGM